MAGARKKVQGHEKTGGVVVVVVVVVVIVLGTRTRQPSSVAFGAAASYHGRHVSEA